MEDRGAHSALATTPSVVLQKCPPDNFIRRPGRHAAEGRRWRREAPSGVTRQDIENGAQIRQLFFVFFCPHIRKIGVGTVG